MDRESVKAFIREVIGANTLMEDTPKWVSIRCPLAPWTHDRGEDKRPSAGISVAEGGTSIFNCYGCHHKGPLVHLLDLLSQYTGDDFSELSEQLEKEEFFGVSVPDWGSAVATTALPQPIENAHQYLDLYDTVTSHPYLTRRGISSATARLLDLRLDPEDSDGDERILFPVFSPSGGFYGFTGRATHKSARLKVRDYHGLPKRFCLLGSHLIPTDARYVCLVEGLFDMARMVEFGHPACAFMSSTLTDAQAELVRDIGLPTYFFHDNDTAGLDALDKAMDLLCHDVPLMTVTYPRRKLRNRKTGKVRPLKDPGELRENEVAEMIATASLVA